MWARTNQLLQVLTWEFPVNNFCFPGFPLCFISGVASKQPTELPNVIKKEHKYRDLTRSTESPNLRWALGVFTAVVSTISWNIRLLGVSPNMQRKESFITKAYWGPGLCLINTDVCFLKNFRVCFSVFKSWSMRKLTGDVKVRVTGDLQTQVIKHYYSVFYKNIYVT